jgi:hypothetical protein
MTKFGSYTWIGEEGWRKTELLTPEQIAMCASTTKPTPISQILGVTVAIGLILGVIWLVTRK